MISRCSELNMVSTLEIRPTMGLSKYTCKEKVADNIIGETVYNIYATGKQLLLNNIITN